MQILSEITQLKSICKELREEGRSLALVPTMGFLHEGHLSLIRLAKEHGDKVMVTRFVNPTQFAPGEDLDAYPNDVEHDHKSCREAGADFIFEPERSVMYPKEQAIYVDAPELSKFLCGKTRPTHFRGVCTIVSKLFNLIQPDVAVFGEKDWQQLTIIKRMVEDLNFSVRIIGGPLVREEDGLAMSSRNAYMSAEERALAPHINKGLLAVKEMISKGEEDTSKLYDFYHHYIEQNIPLAKVDYFSIFDADSLLPLDKYTTNARVAVAVYVGKARLLDNIRL